MQIVYHIGVNCTDGERLLRSLVRSADALSQAGVAVPGPGRYRKLLRETVQNLGGNPPPPGTRDVLVDAIADDSAAHRMILSNSAFLCQPNRVFEGGQFYGMAAFKAATLRSLFPQDELSLFMAVRNPATFVPAVWTQARARTIAGYLGQIDPRALRWSDVVARIRAAVPDVPLTVWCNEDTPLIWNELLHRLSGLPAEVPMAGAHDLLSAIMAPEGFQRFLGYLESHPPASDMQLRRVIGAFLDKYAIEDEIAEEFDIPGWDADIVADLTAAYEADIAAIAAIEGVTFVSP